jgi:hypothetical protein
VGSLTEDIRSPALPEHEPGVQILLPLFLLRVTRISLCSLKKSTAFCNMNPCILVEVHVCLGRNVVPPFSG